MYNTQKMSHIYFAKFFPFWTYKLKYFLVNKRVFYVIQIAQASNKAFDKNVSDIFERILGLYLLWLVRYRVGILIWQYVADGLPIVLCLRLIWSVIFNFRFVKFTKFVTKMLKMHKNLSYR